MSTKDQLEAMRAEIESHVENLRQLRKAATAEDASDDVLAQYGEAIKFGMWMAEDNQKIVGAEDENWPEPDGYRAYEAGIIPTSR